MDAAENMRPHWYNISYQKVHVYFSLFLGVAFRCRFCVCACVCVMGGEWVWKNESQLDSLFFFYEQYSTAQLRRYFNRPWCTQMKKMFTRIHTLPHLSKEKRDDLTAHSYPSCFSSSSSSTPLFLPPFLSHSSLTLHLPPQDKFRVRAAHRGRRG